MQAIKSVFDARAEYNATVCAMRVARRRLLNSYAVSLRQLSTELPDENDGTLFLFNLDHRICGSVWFIY
jgi:hypothetical protein